jgi:type III restriction enzyme
MELRGYQETAVKELKEKSNKLLQLNRNSTITFEAPTGSGKTVMMADYLKQLVEDREDDKHFSFLWAAPRQLHTQSKEKLEKYFYDSKALRCSYFEDLNDKRIDENEILFLNWESINKADNIYIRENENDFNLSKVISNTIDDDRTIILVIDESHFAAKTETSQELIQLIQAKISIEVSATPHITNEDEKVKVYREHVIEDEMIKKRIVINPGFKNIIEKQRLDELKIKSEAAESTNDFVIRKAIDKRVELKSFLKQEDSEVNPLLLIQLPDKKQGGEDLKDEIISILKDKHKITVENGKLAIYLSEDKANLENISMNDNEAELMIFKQAIALGWDCPRACILVLFRDWKSYTFSIQTVGRILRMPELKHYNNDELNNGFVFTNLSDISIQEDIAGDYLQINYSYRKPIYKNLSLTSYHSKRFREETRLSPKYVKDFLEATDELMLAKNIKTEVDEVYAKLISDGLITNPDKPFEHLEENVDMFDEHSKEIVSFKQNEVEIQKLFDSFVIESLHPLFPEKRSIDKVKRSIYKFFQYNFPTKFEYNGIHAQMVVLNPSNQPKFIDAINKAKETYLSKVGSGKKEIIKNESWEIPSSISLNNNHIETKNKQSIMEPFFQYYRASDVEKDFIKEHLDKNDKIEWWFKNGDSGANYFAVKYVKNKEQIPFYVDWIVKYKDGKVGLFDTKEGITAETAKEKAEGLAKYIKEENKKGKHLMGGIVIHKDNSWRYNDDETYKYNPKDLSNWKFL